MHNPSPTGRRPRELFPVAPRRKVAGGARPWPPRSFVGDRLTCVPREAHPGHSLTSEDALSCFSFLRERKAPWFFCFVDGEKWLWDVGGLGSE